MNHGWKKAIWVAALSGLATAVGAIGCGGNPQSGTTGSGGAAEGGGPITGAGGGDGGSTQVITTATASTTTTTTQKKLGPPYPVVLCHGFFGFDKLFEGLSYFYGIPEALADVGETQVYTPAVDPFNSSDFRAEQLIGHIEDILSETGHEKVILIGHSQGGLDARAVASKRPDLIAAVVTVATPHGGSAVADVALGLVDDPAAQAVVDALVKVLAGPLWDEVGDETSIAKALYLFSQPGIEEFNATHPDAPGVFYASITGRTDYSLGGEACLPDVELPFVTQYNTDKDPVDPLFAPTEALIDGGFGKNDPNDGLVRVENARWGQFWGCVPADHMDEVGQLIGDDPGLGNPYDHKAMWVGIVQHLRQEGY